MLSLGSLVGFVSVLGIASRNALMLLGHYRHLREHEGIPPGTALVLQGAEERLLPILMTALCAALSLLPIVVRGRLPGYEIEHPMALVILCGLLTSTVLNLLLLPALYGALSHQPAGAQPEGCLMAAAHLKAALLLCSALLCGSPPGCCARHMPMRVRRVPTCRGPVARRLPAARGYQRRTRPAARAVGWMPMREWRRQPPCPIPASRTWRRIWG